jgi:2'-5' RNA ligase
VELLLDAAAERAVRSEWQRLHEAGLPSELRPGADASHRPHLTLWAGAGILPESEALLSSAVAGLSLPLQLGAVMLFGPHRDRYVLVHAVVASAALLELQRRVAEVCGADPAGYFGPGRWTPHVTVARRVLATQLPDVLAELTSVSAVDRAIDVTECRRWDSDARRTWLL